MEDPCQNLREQAAAALTELEQASEAMAQFSVIEPYRTEERPDETAAYLERMHAAFERERIAWEAYYQVNLKLLECIREAYRQKPSQENAR